MVEVKVPATSANIGPGFDSFGLAFNIYNSYKFTIDHNDNFKVLIKDKNNRNYTIPDDKNLIIKTANYLQNVSIPEIDLNKVKIKVRLNYPLDRGLGSSSNAIIGTIMGLNILFNLRLTELEILNLALKIEGHPDNIVPTLLGGFTISGIEDNNVNYEKFLINDNFDFLLFIPDFKTNTKKARELISKNILINDAVKNIKNASLLSAGLIQGNLDLIDKGKEDYLHQNQRIKLNHKLEKIFNILNNKIEIPMFLSGSGPTLLLINDQKFEQEEEIILKYAKKYKISNTIVKTNGNNKGIIINKVGD
ncbi:MAG: homoserine kinase [Halanaerobiales bacterium]|nr:homoserine kinase [Halanaerobiales bacterium]